MKEERSCTNPLVALLVARMGSDGLSTSALAVRLGISQGYLSQLLQEYKPIDAANDSLIRECAKYLHISPITSFLLAGRLMREDFYDPQWSFEQHLEEALKFVSKAGLAQDAAVSFAQLGSLPTSVQYLIVLLYEMAYEQELMPGRISFESLQGALQPRVPFTVRKVKFR